MKKITLLLLFLVFSSYIVSAHPHIFIKTGVTVCFNGNLINKLKIEFEFDKVFSQELMQTFDNNKNYTFEQSEIEILEKKAFSNLVNYNYLIYVTDNDKKLTTDNITNFTASYKDGVVTYKFEIITDIKISESKKTVKIAAYDHSYYFSVEIKSVKFENDNFISSSYEIIEDRKQAFYYNQIFPDCIILSVNK